MTMTKSPPRLARWLLELFVVEQKASPIIGDLREEFSAVAFQRGPQFARRWYWRQAAKTIPHLWLAQLAMQPWRTFRALMAGLLALTLAYMPLYLLYIFPILHVHLQGGGVWLRLLGLLAQIPSTEEPLSFRWAWQEGLSGLHLMLPPMLVSWALARFSKRRDAAVTISLTFATIVLGIIGVLVDKQLVTTPSSAWFLVWLAHGDAMVVCPIAIFTGGMIERVTAPTGVA
jgi:hypothetical protein